MTKDLLKGVSLHKNAGIRIQKSRTIYFDPFLLDENRKDADFIFISHSHDDHLDTDSIKNIVREDTVLVAPENCIEALKTAGFGNTLGVLPSKSYEAAGLKFRTVPMYNIGKKFHKKENDWVGYIVYIDDAAYYFAGDTDLIPEMEEIQADVAFLPVGGTYTMTADEAVRAAGIIKPRIAVPMHYADVAGTKEDAEYFIKNLDPAIESAVIKGR
ncbi:MAG: MBL fold metallo-hydrolase [Clostridiaceae bacterium]|jgi:L-ascorbate metabolism protein UlaG (beta-lactamase superfamily)|nr:MBL fold metallo-hydrolase [Clostridiaceae bacterium]